MTEVGSRSGEGGRWRVALVAACLFTLFLQGYWIWSMFELYGAMPETLNYHGESTSTPLVYRVVKSSRDGQVRTRDLIDYRLASPGYRYRSQNRLVAGTAYSLPVLRRGHVFYVSFVAALDKSWRTPSILVPTLLGLAGNLWMIAFALLLSVRVPGIFAARLLVLILLSELSWIGQGNTFLSHWVWLDATMVVYSALGYAASLLLVAIYASTFARPLNTARKSLLAFAWLSAFIACVLDVSYQLAPLASRAELLTTPLWASWLMEAVPVIAAFVALGGGLRAVRGLERVHLIWASASLGMLFLPLAIGAVVSLYIPTFYFTAAAIGDVTALLAPVGLSYVLLNRRVLDVGFSLNRATVFAVLSLLVFGAFNLAEWALGGWLSSLNRTANAGISAGLAVALGLSLKPMHDGVERVVDRVFFHKRYEVERALLALTQKAPHFRDARTLLRETEAVLSERAGASSVSFLIEEHGRFGNVDPDDGAIVALRTWDAVLDLYSLQTALIGSFAFPMIVRGKLTGALVVGPKPYNEPYAPDELSAIDRLAKAVGIALDGLNRVSDEDYASVYAMMRSLQADMAGIVGEIHALSEQLATFQASI